MGGFGSGPYGAGMKMSKETVNMHRFLDISTIKNVLQKGRIFFIQEKGIVLKFQVKEDEIHLFGILNGVKKDGFIGISWTKCTYGGKRPWFLCPYCSERTTKLYFKRSEILCRKCGNLTYRRCQVAGDGIAEIDMKLWKIHKRLGIEHIELWEHGLPEKKPKGMHYSTFLKLKVELIRLREKRAEAWLTGARAILKR